MNLDLSALSQSIGARLGLEIADRNSGAPAWDFAITAWLPVALLLIRVASEAIWIPLIFIPLLKDRKKARNVFDDAFISFFSFILEAHAVISTLFFNGGCTPWSTDACIIGWPDQHTLNILQRLYFLFMFQYYAYEMLGTVLRVGTQLKTEMVVHHIATMMLIFLSYRINLVRYGTMWMALFDISNPLLHAAKVCHALKLPLLKDIMLPVFALTFFVARVASAPYSILRPALTQSIYILPRLWSVTFISLMIFVCGLQLVWFYKIVQIALNGDKEKGENASKKTQ